MSNSSSQLALLDVNGKPLNFTTGSAAGTSQYDWFDYYKNEGLTVTGLTAKGSSAYQNDFLATVGLGFTLTAVTNARGGVVTTNSTSTTKIADIPFADDSAAFYVAVRMKLNEAPATSHYWLVGATDGTFTHGILLGYTQGGSSTNWEGYIDNANTIVSTIALDTSFHDIRGYFMPAVGAHGTFYLAVDNEAFQSIALTVTPTLTALYASMLNSTTGATVAQVDKMLILTSVP